jgi:hypothetical protein
MSVNGAMSLNGITALSARPRQNAIQERADFHH